MCVALNSEFFGTEWFGAGLFRTELLGTKLFGIEPFRTEFIRFNLPFLNREPPNCRCSSVISKLANKLAGD